MWSKDYIFKIFSSFDRLNLLSFFFEKQVEIIKKSGFTIIKAVEIFEYGKNNDGY